MTAVHPTIISTIKELQSLPSLFNFFLAGGTNLALRYNHRISNDIDLVSNIVIGKNGFEKIVNEVANFYGSQKVIINLINQELEEQFLFLRLFISKSDITIKVEILQNIQYLFAHEEYNEIKLLSKKDIGLLKLMSASNRLANKDIYDLDYITDENPLVELFNDFKIKSAKFNHSKYKCIFDLDDEVSPLDDLSLLLKFDEKNKITDNKPFHSDNRIDIIEGSKTWQEARVEWRLKVRKLYTHLGQTFTQ